MKPPTPPLSPVTSGGQVPGPKIFNTDVIPYSHTTTTPWKYDVFLSFRGIDTRKNFTGHLYRALFDRGIRAFLDDEKLQSGDNISPTLLKAIEESQIVIVIFSTNYASSTWCLDELARAVEGREVRGQKIFPVFYDVYPYEVRNQTGYFGEAFSQHEVLFKDETEKIRKWRSALREVANLTGWDLRHGNEAKAIQDIVERVLIESRSTLISESKGLFGIDSRVDQILSLLDMSRIFDGHVIGIWGCGGIGKTTLARVVFERICSQFDACSFLANVRAVSQRQGLVQLQQQLLSDTMPHYYANVHGIDVGVQIIKRRLCRKRVLIIVDDVSDLVQLQALCGAHDWFGPGSRIIITSRDRRLLCAYGVDEIFEVMALSDDQVYQLFSWKCFDTYPVQEEFTKISRDILRSSGAIPLVVEVLGSFLCGRSVGEWSDAAEHLKRIPNGQISDVLKVCLHGLSGTEKKVFLDMACFFNGEDIDSVQRILESSGISPDIIKVLMNKSLVTLSRGKVWMHDLIQDLGREIVRAESVDPGERSRLWLPEDIIHILANNEGTSNVEGILLDSLEQMDVELTIDPFLNMRNLRFLKIRNVNFSGNLEYRCDELRYLDWHLCPLEYLPSDFKSDKLVALIMQSSRITKLWPEVKRCNMLKLLDLSDSQDLIETPDFADVPNLERLALEGCTSLVEVHPSIGFLKKLELLNMRDCISVQNLPPFIEMESLQVLSLSGCSRLREFPKIVGSMKSLSELHLDWTGIEELPIPIELTSLSFVNLEHCRNLRHLPTAILASPSLRRINLTGCSKLRNIPEYLTSGSQCSVECLEELDISGTSSGEGAIQGLGEVECLEELDISGTSSGEGAIQGLDLSEVQLDPPPLTSTVVESLPFQRCTHPPSLPWLQHVRNLCPDWVFSPLARLHYWIFPKSRDNKAYSSGLDLSLSDDSREITSFEIRMCNHPDYWIDFRYGSDVSTSDVATTSCDPLKFFEANSLESIVPLILKVDVKAIEMPRIVRRGTISSMLQNFPNWHTYRFPFLEEAKQKDTSMPQHASLLGGGKELVQSVPSEPKQEDEMPESNVKQKVETEEHNSSSALQKLILYCSLFPSDYEFTKHEVVQLWVAEGLIVEERSRETTMEDVGNRHFDSLVTEGFFKQSRCDFIVDFDSVCSVPMYSPGRIFYKLGKKISSHPEYFRAVDSKFDGASESMTKVQHLSLIYKDINDMIFGVLPSFENLRTLLLLSGHGSSIKRVPGELFLRLKKLKTLNLSRTLISELPSTIEDLQDLRYLDVSYTLIARLPESICSLEKLQTLKLRGCKELFDIPRSLHKLAALRHLDFDIIRQLDFMPAQMGKLSNLQSLSAFLIGRDDQGRGIKELNNFKNLGGTLRIFRLENVCKEDAKEVDLKSKKRLQRLDFRWSKLMSEKKEMQNEILNYLEPPTSLKELQILFYSGTKLPSWLSGITDLVVLTLYKCANCELLPSLGQLPNLKFISIVEMNELTTIEQTFFRSTDSKSFKAFPKLEILEIDIMLNLEKWEKVKEDDMESLIKLRMESCPELVSIPSFSGHKSLKYLELNHCPKLSLDCNALPTSLESLIIRDCAKLREWCPTEGHQDLGKLGKKRPSLQNSKRNGISLKKKGKVIRKVKEHYKKLDSSATGPRRTSVSLTMRPSMSRSLRPSKDETPQSPVID